MDSTEMTFEATASRETFYGERGATAVTDVLAQSASVGPCALSARLA